MNYTKISLDLGIAKEWTHVTDASTLSIQLSIKSRKKSWNVWKKSVDVYRDLSY